MELEIWKDVVNYEGLYQVSNLGNVKSLSREVYHKHSGKLTIKERIRKTYINKKTGYKYTTLSKNGKISVFTIHNLVACSFLSFINKNRKIVVDHIDNNKLNNNLSNLQIITNRENTSKGKTNETGFTGVYKSLNNFRARIIVNNKSINLGSFKSKDDAKKAYENKKASLL
jgi:hypothetical protein